MKFIKQALAAICLCLATLAGAQTPDVGFGTGDLNGWTGGPSVGTQNGPYGSSGIGVSTVNGTQTISCCGTNTWTISPYTGSYMVGMQPGSMSNYSAMTTALGLSSSSITALNGQVASTGGSITSTAWIAKDFTFSAGTTFKMAWVYTSTDYVPFNDGSIATLVNKNSATTVGTINGVSAQYILLGATNPGTGNYSTGSYGSTGWEQINYNITTAGDYKVGFGVFNQGDTALSPVLFVNDNLGTVTKNGTAFGAVASNDPTMPSGGGSSSTPTVTGTSTTNSVATSSVNGTPVVTTAVAYGDTTTTVDRDNSRGAQTPQKLTVTQTTTVTNTTPVTITTTTTTPVTITTTTTPVTVTTYSDNTTSSANGTPVVTTSTTNTVATSSVNGLEIDQTQNNKDYATRIDQLAKLGQINGALNHSLDSDVLGRHPNGTQGWNGRDGVDWVNIQGSRSNNPDSTSFNSSRIGVGYDRRISSDLTVGAQYHRVQTNMSSENGSGQLQKDAIGVYALKGYKDWLFKADVAGAVNRYSTAHSLPELGYANNTSTNGVDLWVNGRAYTPAYRGIRPFVGVRYDLTKTNGAIDSGSSMTAVTYDPVRLSQTSYESGVRIEQSVPVLPSTNVYAEVSRNTQDLNTVSAGLSTNVKDRTQVRLGFNSQRFNGFVNNSAQASVQIAF